MPLTHGGAVKLTTSRYFTPSGASIQGKGIVPDIVEEESAASSAGLVGGNGRAGPGAARRATYSMGLDALKHYAAQDATVPAGCWPPERWCPEATAGPDATGVADPLSCRAMLAWLIDLVLHLDRHLVELLARFGPVDLPDPVRGHLLPRRDWW